MYAHDFLAPGSTAQDFLDVIEGMLTAHPAWVFIEQHAGQRIWRCLGSENDFGADFHVSMTITETTTSIRIRAFENWNSSTKALARPCVRSAPVKFVGADGSLDNGAEFTSGVNYFNGAALLTHFLYVPDGAGLEYWVSVTQNRIIASSRRGADLLHASIYVGHFESFIPDHPNENPLTIIGPNQTSTSLTVYTVGAWSRHPGREGLTAHKESFAVYPMISGVASDWTKTEGTVGIGGAIDLFHNKPVGSRMLCRPLATGGAVWGHLRGLYLNILDVSVVAGVALGDTITIDGDTWVYLGANGNWVNASV